MYAKRNNHSYTFYRNCGYFRKRTGVLGETRLLQFGGNIDGQPNPLVLDLGVERFQVRILFVSSVIVTAFTACTAACGLIDIS